MQSYCKFELAEFIGLIGLSSWFEHITVRAPRSLNLSPVIEARLWESPPFFLQESRVSLFLH
jgi:hypothetical protein